MVFRPGRRERLSRSSASGRARSPCAGAGIERLLARYDVDNDDAMAYLEERLRRIGVLKALRGARASQPGDEIEIAGVTFELDPGAPASARRPS